MTTITQVQYDRLHQIALEARELWHDLRTLEFQAYEITNEEDQTGYTSDLVLQSDVDIDVVLKYLGITVEEKP